MQAGGPRWWGAAPDAALTAAGAVLALLTRGVRAVRRDDRPLHPRGVVLRGTLRTGVDPDAPGAVPAYDGPVVVRVSRSAGLPPPLPDVHGLAFRWQTAGRTNDVLLSSTGTGRIGRFVLAARRSPWSGSLGSVMPFRTDDGPVVLAARPAPASGPRPEHVVDVELLSARSDGPWHRWGRLTAAVEEPTDPRFDPVLHAPDGLGTYRWAAVLRLPSYRAARGRGLDHPLNRPR
ncbi:hypothetical protein [Cellulomonas xylanilytica]|uniref:Phosphodiesterase n=1 Tax=Cellulomonas xylanilytica TaxID=233583 RepID=A0A510V9G8_9CELL|nr:hypothetical protein [Cellulomonas xylanilytica]GEK22611.1 hypothetical protein CXY01_31310 [Cellulomonas xylanilytica]